MGYLPLDNSWRLYPISYIYESEQFDFFSSRVNLKERSGRQSSRSWLNGKLRFVSPTAPFPRNFRARGKTMPGGSVGCRHVRGEAERYAQSARSSGRPTSLHEPPSWTLSRKEQP